MTKKKKKKKKKKNRGISCIIEPRREKPGLRDFRPGPTQTGLYSHRKWLEAGNFGFRKQRNCTIRVAKTKALISFAVTAKLICVFVFAYADCWFSHEAAHILFVAVLYQIPQSHKGAIIGLLFL